MKKNKKTRQQVALLSLESNLEKYQKELKVEQSFLIEPHKPNREEYIKSKIERTTLEINTLKNRLEVIG